MMRFLHKKYIASQKSVTFQEESFQYTQNKYDLQLVNSYDYNNVKNTLFRAETDLLQSKYDYLFKNQNVRFLYGKISNILTYDSIYYFYFSWYFNVLFLEEKIHNFLTKFGICLSILGLLLLIGRWVGLISSNDGITIQITEVKKRTIIQTVSASGKIQPEVEVKISPDVSGEVVKLFVREGQQVDKGDLLLMIKPDTYKSILEMKQH